MKNKLLQYEKKANREWTLMISRGCTKKTLSLVDGVMFEVTISCSSIIYIVKYLF